ncbi:MAG: sulfite exporter TauE/SafE family protein [Pirellulales bacterium]
MPTLPVTPTEITIAIVLTIVGAAIQGNVGIGFAVIAAPILLLVNPAFVPAPIVLAAMLLVVLMALREWRDVIVEDIGLAVFGRTVGMLPAAYAISAFPKSVYELLFATLVMLGAVLSALGWHIPTTPRNVVLASIVSGFMSTVSSVGGPPMALLYQNEAGPRIRATISAIFTIGGMVTLAGLWWAGRFGQVELLLGLLLMPGVVMGFAISGYTTALVDRAHIKPAVLAISMLSALVVMLRALAAHL